VPPRRRRLETLLLLCGIVLLAFWAYASLEAALYQRFENRELDAILRSRGADSGPPEGGPHTSTLDVPASTDAGADFRRPNPRPVPGSAIGRIEIPRLGVSTIVRAGSDARTLRLAVGHIPGTALPGDGGNVGLAGHRDTFFRRLRDIRPDDEIRLVTAGGVFTYRVARTDVVWPKDVWVLDDTGHPVLTLITCYPFSYVGTAPRRFIVRAELL
jgi:sortase A